jgi:hypothetical protein
MTDHPYTIVARRLFERLGDSYVGAPEPGEDIGAYLTRTMDMVLGLSGGEQVVYNVAWAIYNGHGEARVVDLGRLDKPTKDAVLEAIELWLS